MDCHNQTTALARQITADTAPDRKERETELKPWIREHLPDCLPHPRAVAACLQIEADEAAAGFPGFRVESLDPDELREEVQVMLDEQAAMMARMGKVERNQTVTGQIEVASVKVVEKA